MNNTGGVLGSGPVSSQPSTIPGSRLSPQEIAVGKPDRWPYFEPGLSIVSPGHNRGQIHPCLAVIAVRYVLAGTGVSMPSQYSHMISQSSVTERGGQKKKVQNLLPVPCSLLPCLIFLLP
eukprot:TRINITY_DN143_c0_g2_i1.p2 TRINITY_DN143_c0_g2~~TRINITY_DN143_c0_g2_i1.p2  ORF type:complete len:120 (-),score=2.28 TRINITY_DN143_c0_g2_i1:541-900(-)